MYCQSFRRLQISNFLIFLVLFLRLQPTLNAIAQESSPGQPQNQPAEQSDEGCGFKGVEDVFDCKFLLGYEIASMKGKGFFTNGSTFLQYSAIANIWSGLNTLLDARFTQVQKEDTPPNSTTDTTDTTTTTHRVQSGYLAVGGYYAFYLNNNNSVFIAPLAKAGFEATVEQFQTKRFFNAGVRVGIERANSKPKKELLSYFDVGIGNDESLGSGPKYVFDGMLIAEKIRNAPPLFLSISGATRANDDSNKDPDDFRIRVGIKVSIGKVADIIGSLFNIVTPDKKPDEKTVNTTISTTTTDSTSKEERK